MQAASAPKLERSTSVMSVKDSGTESRVSSSDDTFSRTLDSAKEPSKTESSKTTDAKSASDESEKLEAQSTSETVEAKAGDEEVLNDETDGSDLDQEMQQASELLQRLDESNAALQQDSTLAEENALAEVSASESVDSLTQSKNATFDGEAAATNTGEQSVVAVGSTQISDTSESEILNTESEIAAVSQTMPSDTAQSSAKIEWQDEKMLSRNPMLRATAVAGAKLTSGDAVTTGASPALESAQIGQSIQSAVGQQAQAAIHGLEQASTKIDPSQLSHGAMGIGASVGTLQAGRGLAKGEQSEPTTSIEGAQLGATQSNTLSGLQRLEQAQQLQSPMTLKQDMASEQLAERIQMMMSKNLKNIDIRLDPPELGRMQIRMSMTGELANVQITVSNSAAREMVEQTLPRLREMLMQNGVALAETSVQQQQSGRQQAHQNGGQSFATGQGHSSEQVPEDEPQITVSAPSVNQGISYFA